MSFFLYDAALNGSYTLLVLQQKFPVHQSLFKGTKDETLIDVAPYIFQVEGDVAELTEPELSFKRIVVIESSAGLTALAVHFKEFLYQQFEGRECYFRFWDSRVLKKFLPGSKPRQLDLFFGPVNSFIIKDEQKAIQFSFDSNRLDSKQGNLEEISPLLHSFSKIDTLEKTA